MQNIPIDILKFKKFNVESIETFSEYCEIISSNKFWDYSISYDLTKYKFNSKKNIVIKIDCKINSNSNIAIGVNSKKYQNNFIFSEDFNSKDTNIRLFINASFVHDISHIIFRNSDKTINNKFSIHKIELLESDENFDDSLEQINSKKFEYFHEIPNELNVDSISTTEVCNLECVMCHFNGPNVEKKNGTLRIDQVKKILDTMKPGQSIMFTATGDFLMDKNLSLYLKMANERGLLPEIHTNGTLLKPVLIDELLNYNLKKIRISVDSTDPKQYAKIRRGGKLEDILSAIKYLNYKKKQFPNFKIEINCTLFKNTFNKQFEMEDFWRDKRVDSLSFNSEYYNSIKHRNIFFPPKKRKNCEIKSYFLPNGKIAPCCATCVVQHERDLDWLPKIDDYDNLVNAQADLVKMYNDPNSELRNICKDCHWWMISDKKQTGYIRIIDFNKNRKELNKSFFSTIKNYIIN